MNVYLGVFIGRFQPFHQGHLYSIIQALKSCEKLLILIGSSYRARNIRNPWNYTERKELLENNLKAYDLENKTDLSSRIFYGPLRDYLYSDAAWIKDVRTHIHQVLDLSSNSESKTVAIVGFDKDHSTYYLKLFPEYGRIPINNYKNLNSTPIRLAYFTNGKTDFEALSYETQKFLENFKQEEKKSGDFNPEYFRLREEYELILSYKKAWAHTPYPPIFFTTDAVVICQGKILLIQRKNPPGKNLWATPGGFLEINERTKQGLFRELIEETQIDVPVLLLEQSLVMMKLFDHPERAQVGRVITHAGLIKLDLPECPKVLAHDDALLAKWWDLKDLIKLEDQMHDDHYQIILDLLSLI